MPQQPSSVTPGRHALDGVRERVQPTTLAGQHLLPVLPALGALLPEGGGLRRGTAVTVEESTALALALGAGPSAAGSWVAVVGMPSLGLAAVVEAGLDPGRLALVAPPPRREWATVVAALLDAFDVVLADPPPRVRPADSRRLVARARERGSVLVLVTAAPRAWPAPAELHLRVTASDWHGLGAGHGRLVARRVDVVAGGRGAAARERRVSLWLPGPDGAVTLAEPVPSAPTRPSLREVG